MNTVRLNVRVNRKRPESMTRQIREQLNALIDAGTLVAGSLLPSERELANSLKVARNVVRGANEQLMEAGKLQPQRETDITRLQQEFGCRGKLSRFLLLCARRAAE